jgi:HPt (histidine-containing phosphotransfer) domain-containing protein
MRARPSTTTVTCNHHFRLAANDCLPLALAVRGNIDPEALIIKIIPGDDRVQRIVSLYLEHTPQLMNHIRATHAGGGRSVAEAAHALKSLSHNIGAVAVGDLCVRIETAAREGVFYDDCQIKLLRCSRSQTGADLQYPKLRCVA